MPNDYAAVARRFDVPPARAAAGNGHAYSYGGVTEATHVEQMLYTTAEPARGSGSQFTPWTGTAVLIPHEVDAYVRAYVDLAHEMDVVQGIYVDESDGLTLYTVYRGDFRTATDVLYPLYDQVMDMFPDCLAKYRLISELHADGNPFLAHARRVL